MNLINFKGHHQVHDPLTMKNPTIKHLEVIMALPTGIFYHLWITTELLNVTWHKLELYVSQIHYNIFPINIHSQKPPLNIIYFKQLEIFLSSSNFLPPYFNFFRMGIPQIITSTKFLTFFMIALENHSYQSYHCHKLY